MASEHPVKPRARRRGKPIEVWVNDNEKTLITARAAKAGLSRSGYLRAVGLNYPIPSVVDLAAVTDLAKVNGDLGRVAGLLKLWLANKQSRYGDSIDIEAILSDFRRLQAESLAIMSRIVK